MNYDTVVSYFIGFIGHYIPISCLNNYSLKVVHLSIYEYCNFNPDKL